MVKRAFSILAVTAAAGIALTPVAASAATAAPAVLALSSSPSQVGPGVPSDTLVTFAVTSAGTLSLTTPGFADLGGGTVGSTITGPLGLVTVTDGRAADPATWTVTATSSDWITGGGSPTETIPAGDVTYSPGAFTTTGTIAPGGPPATTLSTAAVPVVTGAGVGDNTATWDPGISVAVPAGAVAGAYSGTITQSVA